MLWAELYAQYENPKPSPEKTGFSAGLCLLFKAPSERRLMGGNINTDMISSICYISSWRFFFAVAKENYSLNDMLSEPAALKVNNIHR